jgi:hypothetical protein
MVSHNPSRGKTAGERRAGQQVEAEKLQLVDFSDRMGMRRC